MMLKPITIKDAIAMLSESLLKNIERESFMREYPSLYLKDGDGGVHEVSSFDLMRDRITCDDGYFDYFEYIVQSEGSCDRLFVEE